MADKTTYIRATTLIGFRELIEDAGADPHAMLKAAHIDPRYLDDLDGMIPYQALVAMGEVAARELKRPSIALEWALRQPDHFPNLGPLMLMGSFVKTLGEFIEFAVKYWRYHTNGFEVQLLNDRATGLAVFRYHVGINAYSTRQASELVLATACMVARKVTDKPEINPSIVRFQHSRPRDVSLHDQIFRCPIEFDSDYTEYLFEPYMLDLKVDGRLRLAKPLVGLFVRNRISRSDAFDGSFTATVALTVLSVLGSGRCNIEFVAESMGLNSKALQRRLATEDTTFSDVLEEVRKNMAKRLLYESNISIERIAGLLEYASTPPFTLAFKRWTGQSPLNFRKAEQSKMS